MQLVFMFIGINIQQPKHNNIYSKGLKASNFIKKRLQHKRFFVKFPKKKA